MASRTHRVTVLVISQLLNYAVQIFTPILLVRILNKAAYGQYQEFFVYVTLISVFINFSIVDNILYFVPKDSQYENKYVSNSAFLLLFTTSIGSVVVYLLKDYFLSINNLFIFLSKFKFYRQVLACKEKI